MAGARSPLRRLVRLGAQTMLALGSAGPLAAQQAADTAAHVGLLVTSLGALPAPASGTSAGATRAGLTLTALYGYEGDRPTPGSSANSSGLRLDLRLPGGAINLGVTGGRRFASCAPQALVAGGEFLELECQDLWMAGADVTLRLVRMDVSDGFNSGCLTIALVAQAGVADPDLRLRRPRDAGARAGMIGLATAIATPWHGVTLVPYITPALGWARVETRHIALRQDAFGALVAADTVPFAHEGERFVLGGGFAVLETRAGVGLHLTARKVFIRGGEIAVGAAFSLGTAWGKRTPRGRSRLDEVRTMVQRGTTSEPPVACYRLSGG